MIQPQTQFSTTFQTEAALITIILNSTTIPRASEVLNTKTLCALSYWMGVHFHMQKFSYSEDNCLLIQFTYRCKKSLIKQETT